jgi:hypothetical protein
MTFKKRWSMMSKHTFKVILELLLIIAELAKDKTIVIDAIKRVQKALQQK